MNTTILRRLTATAAFLVLLPAPRGQAQPAAESKEPQGLHATDRLARDDPAYPAKPACHFKLYEFKLTAGTTYVMDLVSQEFDAFLRLEDAAGQLLTEDDDSGGNQNARIIFKALQTGTYRIIATTFQPQQFGRFTLDVLPLGSPLAFESLQVEGQPTERGDITVLPRPLQLANPILGQQEDIHGYVEYRVTILNHSPTARHRVSLTIPQKADGYMARLSHHLRALKATAELAPASAGTVSLFQPNLPLNYSAHGLDVAVDGRPSAAWGQLALQQDRGDRHARIGQLRHPLFTRSILTATGLAGLLQPHVFQSAVGQPLPTEADPSIGYTSGSTNQGQPYHYIHLDRFHDAAVPVYSWSKHWLGYSSHDGIVLRAAELHGAPAAVLAALRQYVECGGSLLVVGATPLPAGWNWARHDQHGMAAYYPGFGQCLVMPTTDVDQWEPHEWRAIVAMWEQSARPWQAVETPDAANQRFPVLDSLNMPIRDLFSVMLVFAILIGPVNILVLSWARRRIWLLWTVPTFSLLTCAAVVAYMSLTEDWQGRARGEGLTILDESAGRATSIGWLGRYTPYTPGDGLHFSKDTELSPHLLQSTYFGSLPPRTIDWSTDQHLTSNWLVARIPAHFLVRTTAECAQRLVVERHADGGRSCVNGLNATIATVWVADADRQIYTATDIPPDGKAALTRTTRRAAGTGQQLRQAFAAAWLDVVDAIAAEPHAYLQPGCYLAVLDAAPFIPLGLDSPTSERSRSVVFGIMPAR